MHIFYEAAESHLPSLTGSQLAQMGYGLGQLGVEPPARWMQSFLTQVGCASRFQLEKAGSVMASLLQDSVTGRLA